MSLTVEFSGMIFVHYMVMSYDIYSIYYFYLKSFFFFFCHITHNRNSLKLTKKNKKLLIENVVKRKHFYSSEIIFSSIPQERCR